MQAKAKACTIFICDFQDFAKDKQLKEEKKQCLVEMIEGLEGMTESSLTQLMLADCFKMISTNLFRTFANKSKIALSNSVRQQKVNRSRP